MKLFTRALLIVSMLASAASGIVFAFAGSSGSADTGQVQLSLEEYRALLALASDPTKPPRPAPTGYALGTAAVTVSVEDIDGRAAARVRVTMGIDTLENEWVLIPVLPAGSSVESAKVDNKTVQLIATADGLAWSTNRSGSFSMELTYRVDASRSEAGFTLPVPLPRAAAINLQATVPGSNIDATVIPAAGTKTVAQGQSTQILATVPTTSGVQISWRVASTLGHTISRADYKGVVRGEAVVWTGKLGVELFNDESVALPLLPQSVTLGDVSVDGKAATIMVEDGRFTTMVKGRGPHEVVVVFQTGIVRGSGPPSVKVMIPQIPVSRFELQLPGKKELAVTPASNVTSTVGKETTTAVVHVPMTGQVAFSWSEAVPDEIKTELRSNAAIYHLVHAEESVLYVHARVAYEITRGESNVIRLLLPADVQINRIESSSGAVADWRLSTDASGVRTASVFLDRQLRGEIFIDVFYDRSLSADAAQPAIDVPLLRAPSAQRQKGMVALLSSSDLTLNPLEASQVTKVGENQLPAFMREVVEMTVAHTYKYSEATPSLTVEATQPERVHGKFDAQVDTLFSLGDVTLTGSATVQVNVKSGRIMDFRLRLPDDVSLLSLTAPSLRSYKVNEEAGERWVDVEFTQEMEGQFRLDLTYEHILADAEQRIEVPTLGVGGAEVEQGRIAIEALSAVEVHPAVAEQLTALDVNELPRQMVLRTTNPILLAYKYVHSGTPRRLALEVTRHAVLGVQEAAIDEARYKTLFTTDGLLVTTAQFTVRNSSKQFLRVSLPAGSDVWSAFVDGKPEKPALAERGGDEGRDVLIKIINSTQPFDVSLIYATSGERIGRLGTISGTLPVPDILVTASHWDVFLPESLAYGRLRSNLELVGERGRISAEAMQAEMVALDAAGGAHETMQPLRISVPAAGVQFAFEKLYANQQGQAAWFELSYASAGGAMLGQSASLLGTLLFWIGMGLYFRYSGSLRRRLALAASLSGLVIAAIALGAYDVNPRTATILSGLAILTLTVTLARRHLSTLRTQPRGQV